MPSVTVNIIGVIAVMHFKKDVYEYRQPFRQLEITGTSEFKVQNSDYPLFSVAFWQYFNKMSKVTHWNGKKNITVKKNMKNTKWTDAGNAY